MLNADDQLDLLTVLGDRFPDFVPLTDMGVADRDALAKTLAYFEEHGWVELQKVAPNTPGDTVLVSAKATAAGYDEAVRRGGITD
ncbi:hypothetical protein JJJ17_05705 [Paracoccus caeni]|uniref:Uncharacterized protein n=1 Tax=Paracoccus caeni TaxID=657651 RepID=A0A934VZL3_9RHOB|nr:hypothetical protein [Paracoccus caeni]MBK4215418.1 hypothetical protein [Paracoccus caeni]